jgi:hypothetical protein
MAWTTPKTWADGDIPDADDLNTHIRDQMNVLSTHAHSGAAGDGSAALAPISTATFINQGSTPSAPGSSKVNIFSESETLKVRAGASGAAVAIALANHTHTIAEGTLTITENHPDNTTGNDTYEEMATDTVTPTGAKYVTVHTAIYATIVNGSFTGTGYLRLLKAGVQTVVRSKGISTGGTYGFVATDVYIEPAASSTVFSCEGKASGSGLPFQFQGGGQSIQEVRCE